MATSRGTVMPVAGGGVSSLLSRPAATAQPLARAVNDPRFAPPPAAPTPGVVQTPVQIPDMHSNPAYDQAFHNGLGAARASIAAQVRNAMAENARSQAAGDSEANTYSPTVNKIAATQAGGLRQIAGGADTMQRDAGFRSFTPGSATAAPALDAMASYRDFANGAVPLIHQGIADRAASRAAAIQQYQSEMNAQLAMQQAQMDQQRQLAQMQIAAEDRRSNTQHDWTLSQHQWDVENRNQQHQWDVAAGDKNFENTKALDTYRAGQQVNKDTGLTQSATQKIMGSPAFKNTIKGLNNGTLNPAQVFRYYSSQPDVLAVLADNNPTLAQLYAGAQG